MENLLLIQKSTELEELSQKLGFTKTLFLDQDLVLVRGKNQKELLDQIKTAKRKNKLAFYQPETEEMLRFALEHTPIDLVFGFFALSARRFGSDYLQDCSRERENYWLFFSADFDY